MTSEEKNQFRQQILEACEEPITWGDLCDRLTITKAQTTVLLMDLSNDGKIFAKVRDENIYYQRSSTL
jgi:hypothetical protein